LLLSHREIGLVTPCAVTATPIHLIRARSEPRSAIRAGAPSRPRVLGADSGRSIAMTTDGADDLVAFQDVRIISATAPALLCRIGGRNVWLPRRHISGKLWCNGDRGKLFIRRWVARDRHLIDLHGVPISSSPPYVMAPRHPAQLHLMRKNS